MQKVSAIDMPTNELAMWNVGLGSDISIADLARLIAKITGFQGTIHFDATKPDGTPRKLMDVSRLKALGWQASISLEDGVQQVYNELMINRPW